MKYINTSYGLFDSSTLSTYNETNNGGGLGGGEGKITLPAENTKLYVSMDLYAYGTCYALQVYFSDADYNTVAPSTVQIYINSTKNTLNLQTNNVNRLSASYVSKTWYKVYLVVDSVAGTINFYVDGEKIGTYSEYLTTGIKAISCKIKLGNSSKAKNIIISDEYFPMTETVVLIPSTVNANGWTYNNSNNKYSTESENSTLQLTPDLSGLDAYDITAVNICPVTQKQGDTIKNLQCEMGEYSQLKEIKQGLYFTDLPTNLNTITITAKI